MERNELGSLFPTTYYLYQNWIGFNPWFIHTIQILYVFLYLHHNFQLAIKFFETFRSTWQGCTLIQSLYIFVIEGFSYLLEQIVSQTCVWGISLPWSSQQLVNGHYMLMNHFSLLLNKRTIASKLINVWNIFTKPL